MAKHAGEPVMDPAAQYALAYALTTSAGLRGLLTLAAVSVAVHLGLFHPPQSFAWLGSDNVTVVLVLVAAVEVLGDKVPLIDHAFHAVQIALKPVAAAILVGGVVHTQHPLELYALMALGALNALGVHAVSATTRGASTALTAGVANPGLSLVEDIIAVALIVCAFLAPVFAAGAAILLTVLIVRGARAIWRRSRGRQSAATPATMEPPRP
jgi:uncharacterized membrane protein